jgi:SAM-dependent methyltransferase
MDKNTISFGDSDLAHFYDVGLGPVIFADYAADMARRVAAAKPRTVLEIAAGTGIVTRALRDALPATASLTATDLSPGMLEIAKAKFTGDENVAVQPADALALPFPDASFDVVACQFGVMFYPDKDKGHREAMRVLKPGGRYIFSVWDAHRNNPFARVVQEMIERVFPVDPPQFMKVPFSYGFDAIQDSLLGDGLPELTAHVIAVDKTIPDVRLFAAGMVLGSPFRDQLKARGIAPEPAVDNLTKEYERAFGSPARMRLRAIVYEARKA